MKKQLLLMVPIAVGIALSLSSCKKDRKGDSLLIAEEAALHTDDQNVFSGEVDAVVSDADLVLETTATLAGRGDTVTGIICDALVIVDLDAQPRTIRIEYKGNNCLGYRTRQGVVLVSVPQGTQWKNAGASLTVTYQDLKITRVADNKSITINGTHTFTNVSGGLLINLPTLGTITHSISSNGMSVRFGDNTERNWKVAKQRVFSYNNGVVISTSGTHTEGGETNVAEWGTNRFGGTFTSSTVTPLVVRQDCNFRLTSGEVKHQTAGFTANAKFGLDMNGNATGCPGNGNYFYRLTWTGPAGNSASVLKPY